MRHSSSSAPRGHAHLRHGRFGRIVERRVGGGRGFLQPAEVLQHAPLVFERGVLAGARVGGFDLLALELPQIEQAQFFLLGALELFEFRARRAPVAATRAATPPSSSRLSAKPSSMSRWASAENKSC